MQALAVATVGHVTERKTLPLEELADVRDRARRVKAKRADLKEGSGWTPRRDRTGSGCGRAAGGHRDARRRPPVTAARVHRSHPERVDDASRCRRQSCGSMACKALLLMTACVPPAARRPYVLGLQLATRPAQGRYGGEPFARASGTEQDAVAMPLAEPRRFRPEPSARPPGTRRPEQRLRVWRDR